MTIEEMMVDWKMAQIVHVLSDKELVRRLEFEYYAILAANPNWDKSLEKFLRERGVEQ